MIQEKKLLYKKAYVELLELIENLSKKEQYKIPKKFICYLEENKDKNYIFKINENKDILDQNYMIETKALIVKLYEKYLSSENEKELWEKYDRFCFNQIETEKKDKYSINIFKREKNYNEDTFIYPIVSQDNSIFKKIIKLLKNITRKGK